MKVNIRTLNVHIGSASDTDTASDGLTSMLTGLLGSLVGEQPERSDTAAPAPTGPFRPVPQEELIARVCHEVNRAYCTAIGDTSQVPWAEAPEWQRHSAIEGVKFLQANPEAGPGAAHVNWLKQKHADGWAYGRAKDVYRKLHPCMLPFEELPKEQQVKDHLFVAVVRSLCA